MSESPKRRRWLKFSAIGAGILLALIVFLWALLPSIVRPRLEKGLAELMGAPVSIGKISIWPAASPLAIRNVVIDSPEGYESRVLFSCESAEVRMPIGRLFDRRIAIEELVVSGTRLNLELNANGSRNFRRAAEEQEIVDPPNEEEKPEEKQEKSDDKPEKEKRQVTLKNLTFRDVEIRIADGFSSPTMQTALLRTTGFTLDGLERDADGSVEESLVLMTPELVLAGPDGEQVAALRDVSISRSNEKSSDDLSYFDLASAKAEITAVASTGGKDTPPRNFQAVQQIFANVLSDDEPTKFAPPKASEEKEPATGDLAPDVIYEDSKEKKKKDKSDKKKGPKVFFERIDLPSVAIREIDARGERRILASFRGENLGEEIDENDPPNFESFSAEIPEGQTPSEFDLTSKYNLHIAGEGSALRDAKDGTGTLKIDARDFDLSLLQRTGTGRLNVLADGEFKGGKLRLALSGTMVDFSPDPNISTARLILLRVAEDILNTLDGKTANLKIPIKDASLLDIFLAISEGLEDAAVQ